MRLHGPRVPVEPSKQQPRALRHGARHGRLCCPWPWSRAAPPGGRSGQWVATLLSLHLLLMLLLLGLAFVPPRAAALTVTSTVVFDLRADGSADTPTFPLPAAAVTRAEFTQQAHRSPPRCYAARAQTGPAKQASSRGVEDRVCSFSPLPRVNQSLSDVLSVVRTRAAAAAAATQPMAPATVTIAKTPVALVSAVESFTATMAAPMQALESYFFELGDAFVIDIGGTIEIELGDGGVNLAPSTYATYVNGYLLTPSASSAASTASAIPAKHASRAAEKPGEEKRALPPRVIQASESGTQSADTTASADATGTPRRPSTAQTNTTTAIGLTGQGGERGEAPHKTADAHASVLRSTPNDAALSFFFYNFPRLHCLYNAPALRQRLLSAYLSQLSASSPALLPASAQTAVDADADVDADAANATNRSNSSSSSSSRDRRDSTGSRQSESQDSSKTPRSYISSSGSSSSNESSSSAAAVVDTNVTIDGCAEFLQDSSVLTPPASPATLLTNGYLKTELDLQVMVFDADLWYRMNGGAAKEHVTSSASPWQRSDPYDPASGLSELQQRITASGRVLSAAAPASATSTQTLDDALHRVYDLTRDPAKVCSAPALYTIPLARLLATATSTTGSGSGSGSGSASSSNGGGGGSSDAADSYAGAVKSIKITHQYPPKRIVLVLAQCSSVPLLMSISVTLMNRKGRSGSAEYFLSSVFYFTFLVMYAVVFIIFMVMIVRCEREDATEASARRQAAAKQVTDKDDDDVNTGGRAAAAESAEASSAGAAAKSTRRARKAQTKGKTSRKSRKGKRTRSSREAAKQQQQQDSSSPSSSSLRRRRDGRHRSAAARHAGTEDTTADDSLRSTTSTTRSSGTLSSSLSSSLTTTSTTSTHSTSSSSSDDSRRSSRSTRSSSTASDDDDAAKQRVARHGRARAKDGGSSSRKHKRPPVRKGTSHRRRASNGSLSSTSPASSASSSSSSSTFSSLTAVSAAAERVSASSTAASTAAARQNAPQARADWSAHCWTSLCHSIEQAFFRFRVWWLRSHIYIMLADLQWIVTVVLPLKCLVMVLRGAQFSLLSGMEVVETSYALSVVSIVLSVCVSTIIFALEVLVGLGWGLAYCRLSPGQILILCFASCCGFVAYTCVSTCPVTGQADFFTVNKYVRAQGSGRCESINFFRAGIEVAFHLHNVVQLYVLSTRLGRVVSSFAVAPSCPVPEEDLAYFYRVPTLASTESGSTAWTEAMPTPRAIPLRGAAYYPHTDSGSKSSSRASSQHKKSSRRSTPRSQSSSSRAPHHHRTNSSSSSSSVGSGSERGRWSSSSSLRGNSNSSDAWPHRHHHHHHHHHDAHEQNDEEREAAHRKRYNDALQVYFMKLYLRYSGMRKVFLLLVIWPVLFLIFAFTFYEAEDYYMQVIFEEIESVYLLCFIVLFLRHDPYYC